MVGGTMRVFVAFLALGCLRCTMVTEDSIITSARVDGWQNMISLDFQLPPPGTPGLVTGDGFVCNRTTIEEDVFMTAFRDFTTHGVHHTGLSIGTPTGEDGSFACALFSAHERGLGGGSLGFDDFLFPEGVGMRLKKGEQLFLNAHLFNASDADIIGQAGYEMLVETNEEELEHEAELTVVANFNFEIPPKSFDYEVSRDCEIKGDGTIFAFYPHMHAYGRSMVVTINDEVVWETEFVEEVQGYHPVDLQVKNGDMLSMSCIYDNPNDTPILYGDGCRECEMCTVAFYRYPALDEGLCIVPFD